jgi:hypothetical protein
MADGSVSTLTNPVTGTGTTNTLPKFTGASTIGNSNITDSGTLITLGSNTQISSGALGIGTFPSVGYSLLVGKNITGTTTSFGVYQFGTVQSDVTTTANGFYNQVNTQAASFSLNYNHFLAVQGTIGASSTITTQTAFNVASNLIGGTNNYGFRGQIPSGTNRWNLYMDGTANNYMAGSLGIGGTTIDANLYVTKNITGSGGNPNGIYQNSTIQSDATGSAYVNRTLISTQAASFTLVNLNHYAAEQGTFGAGSVVTNQSGFIARSSLIGGTNNYGFRGAIPSGTNRWNLYMDGTAANYLAGDTAIGTTSLGTATMFTLGGTETAVSAIARGQLINTTLVASANNDVLVGLDIAPTFTNGAFTGVTNIPLRISNSDSGRGITFVSQNFSINSSGASISLNGGIGYNFDISSSASTTPFRFRNSGIVYLQITSTANVLIGTTTDVASSKLTVNSTTQGFLPPRMTAAQRGAISSPATGLMVYQTDGTEGVYVYTSIGWKSLTMV